MIYKCVYCGSETDNEFDSSECAESSFGHHIWFPFRLTPVAGDGAEADAGDVVGETRPAPEHDG